MTSRFWWGLLAALGVSVVLTEVVLHVLGSIEMIPKYEVNHTVLIIAVVCGFVGLYQMDPKGTREMVSVVTPFLPRFGRRSTDAVAVPEAETKVTAVSTDELQPESPVDLTAKPLPERGPDL